MMGIEEKISLEVGLRGGRGDRRARRHRCCGKKRTDGPTHDDDPAPAHLGLRDWVFPLVPS